MRKYLYFYLDLLFYLDKILISIVINKVGKIEMDKIKENNGHGQNREQEIKSKLANGKRNDDIFSDSNGNTENVMKQNDTREDKAVTKGSENRKLGGKPGQINLEGVPIDRGWAWAVLAGTVFQQT